MMMKFLEGVAPPVKIVTPMQRPQSQLSVSGLNLKLMTAPANTSDKAAPGTPAADSHPAWHALSHHEALKRTGSALTGISGEQAVRRSARDGRNELREAKSISPWSLFLV